MATVMLLGAISLGSLAPVAAQPADDGRPQLPPPSSSGECVGGRYLCRAGVESGDAAGGPGSGTNPCVFSVAGFDDVVSELGDLFPTGSDPWEGGGRDDADDPAYERDWVIVSCPATFRSGGLVITDVFQLGEPPDPATMRRVAEQAVVVPLPSPEFSPADADFQVVGLETWIWLDPAQTATTTASACIPPGGYACVTVTSEFVDLTADMADGTDPLICPSGGTPYDRGRSYASQRATDYCAHVYTDAPADSDRYPVRAAGTWSMSYTCAYDADLDGVRESGCGGGFLGYVARVSDPAPLEVRDLQAVAVAGGGHR